MDKQQIIDSLNYVKRGGMYYFTLGQQEVETWALNDTHGIELHFEELRWVMRNPSLRRDDHYKVVGRYDEEEC